MDWQTFTANVNGETNQYIWSECFSTGFFFVSAPEGTLVLTHIMRGDTKLEKNLYLKENSNFDICDVQPDDKLFFTDFNADFIKQRLKGLSKAQLKKLAQDDLDRGRELIEELDQLTLELDAAQEAVEKERSFAALNRKLELFWDKQRHVMSEFQSKLAQLNFIIAFRDAAAVPKAYNSGDPVGVTTLKRRALELNEEGASLKKQNEFRLKVQDCPKALELVKEAVKLDHQTYALDTKLSKELDILENTFVDPKTLRSDLKVLEHRAKAPFATPRDPARLLAKVEDNLDKAKQFIKAVAAARVRVDDLMKLTAQLRKRVKEAGVDCALVEIVKDNSLKNGLFENIWKKKSKRSRKVSIRGNCSGWSSSTWTMSLTMALKWWRDRIRSKKTSKRTLTN
jgi:hypothetical protein